MWYEDVPGCGNSQTNYTSAFNSKWNFNVISKFKSQLKSALNSKWHPITTPWDDRKFYIKISSFELRTCMSKTIFKIYI